MCTLVLLRRPDDPSWPVIIAANRDELRSRPSAPPGRHWPDRPDVRAGLDHGAGGSWLGVNDQQVVAAILNRQGTLGPLDGKRSRGELVLEALDHATAEDAAAALAHLDPEAYRSFNLVVADARDGYWIRNTGEDGMTVLPLLDGVTMLTAGDANDTTSARVRRYLPLFRTAGIPEPSKSEWSDWRLLLGSTSSETGDARDAMCIHTEGDYGTVSSSLMALPADPTDEPVWLYSDGAPDEADYRPVAG